MRAEIVGVGTELLLGQIANSNAQWMSQRLAEIGVDVTHHQVVGDNVERIADSLRLAMSRADVVLITGGLGPTQDDVTREGLSAALGLLLERRPEIESFLRARFEAFGREMPLINLQQADVPAGGRFVLPQRGTAPALAVQTPGGRRVYAMAGVPAEMREMMESLVIPELVALSGPSAIVSRVMKTTGLSESKIAELLDDLFQSSANPTVAYLAGGGEVRVRLTAKATTAVEAEALIDPVADEVARRLGTYVFAESDAPIEVVVSKLLRSAGMTVACAESLTGGGLAARLSREPGSSDVFVGSAVCYTEQAKREVLGVSERTLAEEGVVSEACALEMARGARRIFDSDVAVALTGVAGPDPHGGRDPGTVCAGLAADGVDRARTFRAPGDRDAVRRWAEQAALDMLRRHLEGLPQPSTLGPSTRVEG
ncbi:MAG TPA: competence/damage-inducible protein A [Actinomycetota bacterium]